MCVAVCAVHNILFTTFPIMVMALLDRDFPDESLESTPELYADTRSSSAIYSWPTILSWVVWGAVHGCVCFFFPWYSYDTASIDTSGQNPSIPYALSPPSLPACLPACLSPLSGD